ncbi:unnamed protein product [Staurois parvus]|uniref:Uncharacterized protein n=1 Tax=Staurois parvus TaxID=386267 RepID=A0ABN9HB39_9NEOB|nr:unnamed protein product [Staurois parvus]
MISYGTCSHLSVFTQCIFWKGSGTFLNAKSCVFGSIDFQWKCCIKACTVVCFC